MNGIWVITQKGDIVLCKAVVAWHDSVMGYIGSISDGEFKLGEYATPERAAEVRDEVKRELIAGLVSQSRCEFYKMPEV